MGTRCVSLEITNLNFLKKGNSFWSLGVSFTGFGPVIDSTLWGPYSGQAHALGLYPTHSYGQLKYTTWSSIFV
jgi:hypothetical protein